MKKPNAEPRPSDVKSTSIFDVGSCRLVWDHGGGGGTTSSMTFSGPEKVPSQRSRVASRPSALIEHGWDFSILGRASAHNWTAAGATFATTTGPLLTHLRTPSKCLDGVSRCGPVRR